MKDIDIKSLTYEQAKAMLENTIYEASELLERLEGAGKVTGNCHHARQNICSYAVAELEQRWVK